jgi:outer membrane protein OmpA-like peptidoglycan-associated protein
MKRFFLLCSLLAIAACAPPPPPAPAAVPPAPPPAPPPNNYVVFFPWNSATVTPDAQQILNVAASAYKSGAPASVQVTGYTDTSGSAGYNQRLSERRAQNVAAALSQLGVPPNALVVSGRGENDLRVPTPQGVREPQNRRVEILEGGAAPPPPPPPAPPQS